MQSKLNYDWDQSDKAIIFIYHPKYIFVNFLAQNTIKKNNDKLKTLIATVSNQTD